MSYLIQATPRSPRRATVFYYTQNTGRHDLTPDMDAAKRFGTFAEVDNAVVRLGLSMSFSDVVLSVLSVLK